MYKFVNLHHGYKPVKKLGAARLRQLANHRNNDSKQVPVANGDANPPTMATKTSVIKSVSDVIKTSWENSPTNQEMLPLTREVSPCHREMSSNARNSPVSAIALYEPMSTVAEGHVSSPPVYLQPVTTLPGSSKLCACYPYTFLQPITRALGADTVTRQTFTVLQTPCCGKVALTPLSGQPVIFSGESPAAPSSVQVTRPEGRAQVIEA